MYAFNNDGYFDKHEAKEVDTSFFAPVEKEEETVSLTKAEYERLEQNSRKFELMEDFFKEAGL